MSETNKSFRIRTNILKDSHVSVQLTQDYDLLEILSLKIRQIEDYKVHMSNYGVIVGRVLANDGFGVPNAKVSVFIPIENEDLSNSNITNLYSFTSVTDTNRNNIRYNLLPNETEDICLRAVGTFPHKRAVLDDESTLEVYDKYYKYTTTTNGSGDYMIFGVPTGEQKVHVDLDLSDVGILSQKPRDLVFKGHELSEFDSPTQFKSSTNLDDLTQIISEDKSVIVYPFWGDTSDGEIAISRCDVQIQYKFEPTCLFFGSVMTDNNSGYIGGDCKPSRLVGVNRTLIPSVGTIEMIRKTVDGLVEEYPIDGNRLINEDGVWCYQIPMNLDYIVTDEFGNIVPSDNPNKGIPTRTSVRFRFTIGNEENASSKHRARYLVPSNPDLLDEQIPKINTNIKFEDHYQFGSSTLNGDFRDLYWNKVYSVKNYIPRLQMNNEQNTSHYFALKRTNSVDDANPFPYNTLHYNVRFSFWILCYIIQLLLWIVTIINEVIIQPLAAIVYIIKKILGISIKLPLIGRIYLLGPIGYLANKIPDLWCIGLTITENDYPTAYFPGCDFNVFGINFYKKSGQCQEAKSNGGRCSTNISEMHDKIQRALAQEFEIVHTDLANDWLNGTLYFPLWYWEKKPRKTYLFGLFRKKAKNTFCSCDNPYSKLVVLKPGAVTYENGAPKPNDKINIDVVNSMKTKYGLIKEFTNRDDLKLYYYSFGNVVSDSGNYVRLFSTDIILLGSLNDCDVDDIPKLYNLLPSSTNNEVPLVSTSGSLLPTEKGDASDTLEVGGVTGMDWGYNGKKNNYKGGLYIDLSCGAVKTQLKSCINASRICELGVMQDMEKRVTYANGDSVVYEADGMITKFEIFDNEARSMFATMNHVGFDSSKIENKRFDSSGYYVPKYSSLYPMQFDGGLEQEAPSLSKKLPKKSYDKKDDNYLLFRNGDFFHSYDGNKFPLFNNSFYFYFGLSDGKTAIDALNDKFLSPCTSNKKFPFVINTIGLSANTYCSNDNNYHSAVEFEVLDITMPYSYEFTNPYGIVVNFGDLIDSNNKITLNGVDGASERGYEDGIYTLTVYDANGRKNTEKVNFTKQLIYAETYVEKLGTLYDGSNKDNIISTKNYGSLGISHLYIDGFEYDFSQSSPLQRIGGSEQWSGVVSAVTESITPLDKEKEILIKITSSGEEPNWLASEPEFKRDSEGKVYYNDIEFPIWFPSDYELEITQLCNGELSENVYATFFMIENGTEFEGFLNDVPMSFLLANNSGYKNGITWWISGVGDPSTYAYDVYDNDKWEEIIDTSNYDTSNENDTIKFAQAAYNFKSMMSLLNASQIGGSDASSFALSHNGGKDPVIYKGYHAISEFDDSEINYGNNKINEFELEKSGNGVILAQYPSIVTKNYQYFTTREDREAHSNANNVRTNYEKNKYYHNSMSEVFLGLFTDDDGYEIDEPKRDVVKLPKYALQLDDEPRQEILYTDKAEEYDNYNTKHLNEYPYDDLQRHLICYSVDKRLSYDMEFIDCYNIKNISGNLTNGIMLAYDDNKNIISTSNTTEYTYEYADKTSASILSSTITWNRNAVKKLYTFKIGDVNLVNDATATTLNYPNVVAFSKDLSSSESLNNPTITMTPCSYEIDFNSELVKEENNYVTKMSAIVKKGEDIKIKVNTKNLFTFFNNTVESVAANGNPPIIYNRNDQGGYAQPASNDAYFGGHKLFVVPNTENGTTTQDILLTPPRLVKQTVIENIQSVNAVESLIYDDNNSLKGYNDITYAPSWQFKGSGSNAYATRLDDNRHIFINNLGDSRIGFNDSPTMVINKSSAMAKEETSYGDKRVFKAFKGVDRTDFMDFYIVSDVVIYPTNGDNLDSKLRSITISQPYHIPTIIRIAEFTCDTDTDNGCPYLSKLSFKIRQPEFSNGEKDEFEESFAVTLRNHQNGQNEYIMLTLSETEDNGVIYYTCDKTFTANDWSQAFREEAKEEAPTRALFGAIVVKSKVNNIVYGIHLKDDGEPLV